MTLSTGDGLLDMKNSLFEHLAALRRMLIQLVLSLLLGICVAMPLAPQVMELLKIPFVLSKVGDPNEMLKVMEVTGGFTAAMWTVLWTGVCLSLPLMTCAVANFVFPALNVKEKRYVAVAIVLGVAFFVVGVLLGFYWLVPLGLQWLYGVNAWFGVTCDFILLKDYIGFVGQMLVALGVSFQVPVLVMMLGCLGVLKSRQLRESRRVVFIILMVAAMLLTPGGDPVSMIGVTIPLALLYELCIGVIWLKERSDARQIIE